MTESPKSSASTSSATSATGSSLGETASGGKSGVDAQTGTSGERESGAGSAPPTKSPTDGSGDVPRAHQIVEALRAPSFQQDSQWHDAKAVYATKPRELLTEAADKIEGLEADLFEAVRVAFKRGAITWTQMNYPKLYGRFMAEHLATREGAAAVAVQVGRDVVVFPDAARDEAVVLVGRTLSKGLSDFTV